MFLKREKSHFAGSVLSLSPQPHHPFPLSAEALAKVENLFLAFIFLHCKKINAFQVFVKRFSKYVLSQSLPTRIGNRAFRKIA
jgi:hypothetical protein